MIEAAELRMLDDLESGADIEPGEHTAWISEEREGGAVTRTLRVK